MTFKLGDIIMKKLSIEEKANAYDNVRNKIAARFGSNIAQEIFSEYEESENDRIKKDIVAAVETYGDFTQGRKEEIYDWLKRQGEQKNKINSYKITFEDVLALECSMKTTKITEGGDKLYEMLVPLYNKIHNAYLTEKQGEQTSIIEMKSPEESLGISSKEYNEIVNDCLYSESKPVDNIKPKFKNGQWIVFNGLTLYINEVVQGYYRTTSIGGIPNSYDWNIDNAARLWSIEDAKDGDVLAFDNETIVIFKDLYNATTFHSYCHIEDNIFDISKDDMPDWWEGKGFHPATKYQSDILFQKMKEAGYMWDDKKKELKKIHVIDEGKAEIDYCFTKMMNDEKVSSTLSEENEEYNDEDYGIDGLYHAKRILEKTLGEVDGYQSDDGILEHKCAITAVKKLYEKKPAESIKFDNEFENQVSNLLVSVLNGEHEYNEGFVKYVAQSLLGYAKNELKPTEWSHEDDVMVHDILGCLPVKTRPEYNQRRVDWIKSIKSRVQSQPKQEWKQENREELTEFENAMMHIGDSFFGKNAGLDPNDTAMIKEQAELLLELAPKIEWSEEDEAKLKSACVLIRNTSLSGNDGIIDSTINWIKSFKYKIQPKSEWSEEDMFKVQRICKYLDEAKKYYADIIEVRDCIDWLKQKYVWKPSFEQLEALWCAAEHYLESDDGNVVKLRGKVLESLYNKLKNK